MEQNILSIFEDYLFGKQTQEEKAAFEERLKSDDSLKSEFDEFLSIVEGIHIQEKDRLKKRFAEIRNIQDDKAKNLRRLRIIASVAAVVIVLLVPTFIIYQNLSRPTRLYNKYYIEDSGIPVFMGINTNEDFASAMTEYKDRNYELAYSKFDKVSHNNENDTLQFYMGLCLLNLNKNAEALESFGSINKINSPYYYAAKYYMALTLIRFKDFKNASIYLIETSKCNNCIYKENALRLIEELK